jgi:putative DNA primase/helicase
MIAPNALYIPAELRAISQWVNWKLEERPDRNTGEIKLTKIPYQPHGPKAESDNPDTWSTFEAVLAAYQAGGFSGIGFVLTKDIGIVGVDLDHCRNPETGVIEAWAQRIVDRLNSYTEITPSNEGLRIFIRAKLPPKDRKIGNFECYDSGRYLTVTGNHLPGTPTTIECRQQEMDAVHAEVFPERNQRQPQGAALKPAVPVDLNDETLLQRAFSSKHGDELRRLYSGDISNYPSHSEADLGLCNRLAFWTGADPERIDRLFRASGLYRPKWDEKRGALTYGQMAIAKALEGAGDHYNPHGHCANRHQRKSGRHRKVYLPPVEVTV